MGCIRDALKQAGAWDGKTGRQATPEDVQKFIETNALDARAAEALQNAPPEVQHIVMERGDLKDAANASGALIGRINNATPGWEKGKGKESKDKGKKGKGK